MNEETLKEKFEGRHMEYVVRAHDLIKEAEEEIQTKQVNRKALGLRMIALRQAAAISQIAMADLIGKSRSFLSSVELGKRSIKTADLALFLKNCDGEEEA